MPKEDACHMINPPRIVGGEDVKGSYYARERGTCEIKPSEGF